MRCAPRKKRPTPRTHATLLTSSDLIGLNSARSHSADRSDADSNRQTPPAEWCPFGIASAPKAPISASTAVDAASMRTSYPRNHTDVVLGGAADSVVLSMLSRSTSRVRCSRALHVASGHSCLHTCLHTYLHTCTPSHERSRTPLPLRCLGWRRWSSCPGHPIFGWRRWSSRPGHPGQLDQQALPRPPSPSQ